MEAAGARWRLSRRLRRFRTRWRAFQMPADAAWNWPGSTDTISGFSPRQQQDAIDEACRILFAVQAGDVHCSILRKSIGVAVRGGDGSTSWLKIVGSRTTNNEWTLNGERQAQAIAGVPKPAILREIEWNADGANWHAFQFAVAPSPAVLTTPWCAGPLPSIDDGWLTQLKQAIDRLSAVPLSRWLIHPGHVARVVSGRFGRKAPYFADEWRTAHGDLNWSNLTAPNLALLDWEHWGAAPRGFDAANLLTHSLNAPDLFRKIERLFADDLETPSGIVARLYFFARRLDKIEAGMRDPRGHRPLEAEAKRLLRR